MISSRSESTSVVTTLVECLQYVILINNKNSELCSKLIKSHLLPLIEWSFKGEQVCYRTVFHQVAVLVQYWNRNKNLENYPEFLNLFWSSVINLIESGSIFDAENPESQDLVDRHVVFLQHLKNTAKPKEQQKVKFSEEVQSGHESHLEVATETDSVYNQNLTILVYTILKSYISQIQDKKSQFLIPNVFSLIRLFESREFLIGFSRNFNQSENFLQLYEKLFDWLKTKELACETLVDLTFILLKYVTNDQKKQILESFLELDRQLFAWCVKNAFSHPYNQDRIVQNWIQKPKVGEFLIFVTETNLKIDCSPEFKTLFKLVFAEDEAGGKS